MSLTQEDGSAGNNFDITYGIDNLRRKTVIKDGSDNPLLTRYYFDDYEEEFLPGNKTRTIHYISGGNGLAAIYINDEAAAGNNGLYYAHTDYLGSLTALTSTSGTVVKRFAYDPWGNRRNPENWAEALTDDGSYQYTARGYTMHEHLDGFGLINMNGRVYDPMLSRFLSPDPMLQAPNLPLNYNRYTYCMNNPFLYTDPSGYWFEHWYDWFNPMEYISAGMESFNNHTVKLRQKMVKAGIPDFSVNTSYSGNQGFNVSGNYMGQEVFNTGNRVRNSYSAEAILGRTKVNFTNGINDDGVNFVNNLGVSGKNVNVAANGGGNTTVDDVINKTKSIIDGAGNITTAIDLLKKVGIAVSYIDDFKGGAQISKFCNTFGPIATYTGVVADTYLTGKDILQNPNDNNGWKVVSYLGRNGVAVWGLYNPYVAGGNLIYYVTDIQIQYLDKKGYLQYYIDTQVQDQRNGFYYY